MRGRTLGMVAALAALSLATSGCLQINPHSKRWSRWLERRHQTLCHGLVNVAQDVDQFFGDERLDEEYTATRLILDNRFDHKSSEGIDATIRVRGYVPLPILENRLAVVLGSESEVEDLDNAETRMTENRDVESGLRFLLPEGPWRYILSGGARWSGGPVIYLRPGVRYDGEFGRWALRFTNSIEWDARDGIGDLVHLDLDRVLSPRFYFGSRTGVRYAEDSQGVEIGETLLMRFLPSPLWGLGLDYAVAAETRPAALIDSHRISLRLRSKFLFHWMDQELNNYLLFRQEDDYRLTPGIEFRLRIWFGSQYPGVKLNPPTEGCGEETVIEAPE